MRDAAAALGVAGLFAGLFAGLCAACAPAAGDRPAGEPGGSGGGGTLVDVAAAAGLVHAVASGGPGKEHIRSTVGQGACWIDHDADGDPDLFLPSGATSHRAAYAAGDPALVPWRFYVNRGGRFEEAAARLGLDVPAWGVGCAVGDVDGDGFDDLFVTAAAGGERLLRNRGGAGFEDWTARAGAGGAGFSTGFSTGALFADLDGDADLDLFVAEYLDESKPPPGPCRWHGHEVACGPNGYPEGEPRLYFNDGRGGFAPAGPKSGIAGHRGYGLSAVSLDADLDGRPDLYVANDSSPNHLFLNRGGGRFEEAGLFAGVALSESGTTQAGMGVDAGDLDGDGLEDLVVTNFSDDVHNFYRQDSPGLFSERTHPSGLAAASFSRLGWAPILEDFDLDGDLDLLLTNGHVYPQADAPGTGTGYRQPLQLLFNDGGVFTERPAALGALASTPLAARGAAAADLDGDGDQDLLVVRDGEPPLLLRNDLPPPSARWVKVVLTGTAANREGLGARVEVEAGGRTQVREMRRSRGYLSAGEAVLVVGLGAGAAVDRLAVTWPDGGGEQTCGPLPAGATWRITQGAPCPERPEPVRR